MNLHPEEVRIAGSLRELAMRIETVPEIVEGTLGWRDGRLLAILEGREGMSLRELFELLGELETTPGDFFGRLYRLGAPATEEGHDARFSASKRAVLDALERRLRWKKERDQG